LRIRDIKREEIKEIRELDISEIVEQIYYYRNGRLVLEDEYYDIKNLAQINLICIIPEKL